MSVTELQIRSHKGTYDVSFGVEVEVPETLLSDKFFYVIDSKLTNLYPKQLARVLDRSSTLIVDATESNKSLEKVPGFLDHFVRHKMRKNGAFVAIGGGIIQDLTCFMASIFLRGVPWHFLPTTLLAQADSCIGSKSSINLGEWKNLVGNFTPPSSIHLYTGFLDTLTPADLQSGIGEIIKVHILDGWDSFDALKKDFSDLQSNRSALLKAIERSLLIKKKFIETDEFDTGIRRVLNYGHSFGHAIESATQFEVPHGVAVTMGMDMANFTAMKLRRITIQRFESAHAILTQNYSNFCKVSFSVNHLIDALSKDKKNLSDKLNLVLPGEKEPVSLVEVPNDGHFRSWCGEYIQTYLRN